MAPRWPTISDILNEVLSITAQECEGFDGVGANVDPQ